jgi:hypothetical protein
MKVHPYGVLEIAAECLGEARRGHAMEIEARITIDDMKPE